MTEQQTTDRSPTNGKVNPNFTRKGRKKEWKDLTADPLSEGFDSHPAEYVVGKGQVSWGSVKPGQMFSRSKNGKSLYIKMNEGRAVCLDTQQPIEIKPTIRMSFAVWLVTSFNSTTASKMEPSS